MTTLKAYIEAQAEVSNELADLLVELAEVEGVPSKAVLGLAAIARQQVASLHQIAEATQ